MCAVKSPIPDNISEEYYQISAAILSSFPKYRPPVDLFRFRDDIAQLTPYSRKGQRLSNEQVEEVARLCDEGDLFVSRTDHPIYSQHIVKQLDLILVDRNLKESEVADICLRALALRFSDFADQPVRPVFETLYKDMMVFTEYLWQDRHRIKLFMRRLFREHTLAQHSLNTLAVGLWLFINSMGDGLKRRDLDRAALGFLLHDLGMARIPAFILSKTTPLKPEERDKIPLHPLSGIKTMHKLGLAFDEMRQAVLEHHERLDGSGYPQKLKGEQVSRIGRIAAIADSFSAMIAQRPHASAKEPLVAAQELAADRNRYDTRYTSQLLTAFMTGAFSREGAATTALVLEAQPTRS